MQNITYLLYWRIIFTIRYYNAEVQAGIAALPKTLVARYLALTERMMVFGPNLGEPHTKAFGNGLFELRLKGADGIARVFFCTQTQSGIVMLHSFVKKSQKTPLRELRIAEARLKEVRHDA